MGKMFQMATQSRKLHYSFAYRMLPLMLFGDNGLDVYAVLADPEQSKDYLKEAWDRTAKSLDVEYFEPEGLHSEFRPGKERDVVVVHMPTPIAPPEAYFVIVQFDKAENKIHYYTVEYSMRLDGTKRVVLGKTLKDGQRHNLGAMDSEELEFALKDIERKGAHHFPFRSFE
jgi:hypothetical protein